MPAAPTKVSLQPSLMAYGVEFRSKDESLLMRALARLLRLIGVRDFMGSFWITLGRRIYHPAHVDDPLDHPVIVEHELVHVRQWCEWGPWFAIAYVGLPLPIGLAFCRWYFEREAYLLDLLRVPDEQRLAVIDAVVECLWKGYAWPWPRPWMRRWFQRRCEAITST